MGDALPEAQKERKKENRHAKRGMGRGQGPHLHEQDFGRTIRGTGVRWGSPAPDKGHDRLAARCTVDSHIHWRSHLSLATLEHLECSR